MRNMHPALRKVIAIGSGVMLLGGALRLGSVDPMQRRALELRGKPGIPAFERSMRRPIEAYTPGHWSSTDKATALRQLRDHVTDLLNSDGVTLPDSLKPQKGEVHVLMRRPVFSRNPRISHVADEPHAGDPKGPWRIGPPPASVGIGTNSITLRMVGTGGVYHTPTKWVIGSDGRWSPVSQ